MRLGRLGWFGIVAGVGILATAGVGIFLANPTQPPEPIAADSPPLDPNAPLPVLAEEVAQGNSEALGLLRKRAEIPAKTQPAPLSEAEAAEWIGALEGLRQGSGRFVGAEHVAALAIAASVLDRLAADPAPANWLDAVPPVYHLLILGLGDADSSVRLAAMGEVESRWLWAPGRPIIPAEEKALGRWKEQLHAPLVRCLSDAEAFCRRAAVACLATLPDHAAEPALALILDPDAEVRQQVLSAFAPRRDLLSEDDILPRLYDVDPRVATTAELVLRGRGVSREQVGLGRLIFHPKPEMRATAIPLLIDRDDIDPVVWLVKLSWDPAESVREKAVEALARRDSGEARRRIVEMAVKDPSPAIRDAATRVVPIGSHEATAALPVLPGSTSLLPKAN